MNPLLPYFAQSPFLAALLEHTARRLERAAEPLHCRRREIVRFPAPPGDSLYLLCAGRVKVSCVSDSGKEVTLYLVEAGELFGESGLFGDAPLHELVAETLEDALMCIFRRADIRAALEESPRAASEMLKLISRRRAQAESTLADLVFLEVRPRLAKLLLHLQREQSGRIARGAVIKAKLTHHDLANMIGSTRETTTLILNEFKRQGAVDFLGRRIVVRDPQALEAILASNGSLK